MVNSTAATADINPSFSTPPSLTMAYVVRPWRLGSALFVSMCPHLCWRPLHPDCCDGTDENNGRVQCTNTCMVLGASMREELSQQVAAAEQ
eukprot:5899358-Pyramimonas_sp.AAC.1